MRSFLGGLLIRSTCSLHPTLQLLRKATSIHVRWTSSCPHTRHCESHRPTHNIATRPGYNRTKYHMEQSSSLLARLACPTMVKVSLWAVLEESLSPIELQNCSRRSLLWLYSSRVAILHVGHGTHSNGQMDMMMRMQGTASPSQEPDGYF